MSVFPEPQTTHKEEFDQNGFLVVRDFYGPQQLATLRTGLDRYIYEVVPTLSDREAFFHDRTRPETLKQLQHMGRDPFFEQYRQQPAWLALAEELLGEPCTAQEPEWFNKPPGTDHATPPHQDNYYFCLQPAHVVTLWLALDPVDEENGCLRYVRGSHRGGIRDHCLTNILGFSQGIADYGAPDRNHEVAVRLAPGDLVAHHGETIHRAEPNRSAARQRRAFAMVFRGDSVQRDATRYARYQAALKAQHNAIGLQT